MILQDVIGNKVAQFVINGSVLNIDLSKQKDNELVTVKKDMTSPEYLFDVKDGKLIKQVYLKNNYSVNIKTFDIAFYKNYFTYDKLNRPTPQKMLIERWQFITEESRDAFYESNKDKFLEFTESKFKYSFEKSSASQYFELSTIEYLGEEDYVGKENGRNLEGYYMPYIEQRHTVIEGGV